MLSWVLPRVLTNLSTAFCQGQQACISGHTLSSSLQNCKVAIYVCCHFLIFPDCTAFSGVLCGYRLMSIFSLNHLSAIQCSQVRKRYQNTSITDVSSLFKQSNLYGTHRLYLFNQTDSNWSVHERQRYVRIWNFVDFSTPDLQWACDCEYLILLPLNYRKNCSMVGRQARCCNVVGIFIFNVIHFSYRQKKSNSLLL